MTQNNLCDYNINTRKIFDLQQNQLYPPASNNTVVLYTKLLRVLETHFTLSHSKHTYFTSVSDYSLVERDVPLAENRHSVFSNASLRGLAHCTRDRLLRKLADTNNRPIPTASSSPYNLSHSQEKPCF